MTVCSVSSTESVLSRIETFHPVPWQTEGRRFSLPVPSRRWQVSCAKQDLPSRRLANKRRRIESCGRDYLETPMLISNECAVQRHISPPSTRLEVSRVHHRATSHLQEQEPRLSPPSSKRLGESLLIHHLPNLDTLVIVALLPSMALMRRLPLECRASAAVWLETGDLIVSSAHRSITLSYLNFQAVLRVEKVCACSYLPRSGDQASTTS